jgi:hypothetical protein
LDASNVVLGQQRRIALPRRRPRCRNILKRPRDEGQRGANVVRRPLEPSNPCPLHPLVVEQVLLFGLVCPTEQSDEVRWARITCIQFSYAASTGQSKLRPMISTARGRSADASVQIGTTIADSGWSSH